MGILCCLGIGEKKLLRDGKRLEGVVTKVKTCWWIKVNTKAVRMGPLDGAQFPHVVCFEYKLDGVPYQGSRYLSWSARCPRVGEKITVFADKDAPKNYAVQL